MAGTVSIVIKVKRANGVVEPITLEGTPIPAGFFGAGGILYFLGSALILQFSEGSPKIVVGPGDTLIVEVS